MASKKPTVGPLMMTLRSRGKNQDVQAKESKPEVTEGDSKRTDMKKESKPEVSEEDLKHKGVKILKPEAVKEELRKEVVKENSTQEVVKKKLKPIAKRRAERRKLEGEEAVGNAKLAKIVDVVVEEQKKPVPLHKNKTCEAAEEPQTKLNGDVLGREESSRVVKIVSANKKKCMTATGCIKNHQLRSEASSMESQLSENLEAFSTEDWSVIEGVKPRAERMFDIKLVVCRNKCSKAGKVTVLGSSSEKCLLCKEYLLASTQPGCTTVFPYPPEKHSFLTDSTIHEKLEQDSQAVLVFRQIGEVEIYGLDSLSVALATSSLEGVLENKFPTESGITSVSDARRKEEYSGKHKTSLRRSSVLLDVELKNWISSSEDDVYRNTNEAVKHAILSVVKDESRKNRVEAPQLQTTSFKVLQTTPLRVASPLLFSSALQQLSEAYVSVLDDSVVPLSPSATSENPVTSLATETVKKNISEDPEFANSSLQRKEETLDEVETKQTEVKNSTTESETKQREAKNTASEVRIEITGELINTVTTDSKINNIIAYRDSDDKAEKDRGDCSKTTSIKSNCTDRKDYLDSHKGLSCEIKVPSDIQRNSQSQGLKPVNHLPSTEPSSRHTTRESRSQSSATMNTIHVDCFPPAQPYFDPLEQLQLTQNPPAAGSSSLAPSSVQSLCSIAVLPPTSSLSSIGRLRYVVIDGSNVAMAHGKRKVFSCPGIEICIKYFLQRGHREDQITAFVPQSRLCRPRPTDKAIVGQHLLQKLADRGLVVFTPARKVPGRNIVCYDDRYVLRLAAYTNGIIVTNDNYRDLWLERREWREIIENRLLPFSFVNDLFMPPDDPLGRNGPSLDQFLTDQPQPDVCQTNHKANPQLGFVSTNSNPVSANQRYRKY